MYKMLIKNNGTYSDYSWMKDIPETIIVDGNEISITKKKLVIFDVDTLDELQNEYLVALEKYSASQLVPYKSMVVTNTATIQESVPVNPSVD